MAVRRKQEGPEITALDGTVAATIADSTGAISIGSGGTNWTLPTTRGAEDYHLATDGSGGTSWVLPLKAPVISSTSGQLNADSDSTITIHGSDFATGIVASIHSADSGGTKHGDASTTTLVDGSTLTAVFGAGTIPDTGTVYVEVTQSGISNRLSTGIAVSLDPTTSFTGGSGTNYAESTHLGTYGVGTAGVDWQTKILLHFDKANNSTDLENNQMGPGYNTRTDMYGNAKMSTTQKKFGNTSLYLDGTAGTYIKITDDALATEDGGQLFQWDSNDRRGTWTWDWWQWMNAIEEAYLFDASDSGEVRCYVGSNDALYFGWDPSGSLAQVSGTSDLVAQTWQHICLTYDYSAPQLNCYINGIWKTKTMTSGAINGPDFAHLEIGRKADNSLLFEGYIDEFRFSHGVDRVADSTDPLYVASGRHASGATFTPPSSKYGGPGSKTIPTITFTGVPGAGGGDVDFSEVVNSGNAAGSQKFSDYGLTLTDGGAGSNTATLTGTLTTANSTTVAGQKVKAQVTTSDATCDTTNTDATVTMDSTAKVNAGMTVTGTGIPASTTVLSVTNATTFELSANATATNSNTTLRFVDPNRVSYVNGSDDGSGTHLSIATGAGPAGGERYFWGQHYIGTGAARSISGFNFQPDLIFTKDRQSTNEWRLTASILGVQTALRINDTAGVAADAQGIQSFDDITTPGAGGFTIGTSSVYNVDTNSMMSWAWRAGGTPSADGKIKIDGVETTAVADTDYKNTDITSYTRTTSTGANFTILKYTAANNDNDKWMLHGLSGAPDFWIVKRTDGTGGWITGSSLYPTPGTDYQNFEGDAHVGTTGGYWASTAPDSTKFYVKNEQATGKNGTYIALLWKKKDGVFTCDTYTGTGSSGLTVTLPSPTFRPALIWIKKESGGTNNPWICYDKWRGWGDDNMGFAPVTEWGSLIYLDEETAEQTSSHNEYGLRPSDTGFSFDSAANSQHINGSGNLYNYFAWS